MSGKLPFSSSNAGRVSFTDDIAFESAIFNSEGIIEGIEFFASATPNNQVVIKYSANDDTKNGQGKYGSLAFSYKGDYFVHSIKLTNLPGGTATLTFGNGATAPDYNYALIIASVDLANPDAGVSVSIVTGSVPSQDPTAGIADIGTYRSLILARIKLQGSPSVITQSDIIPSAEASTQSTNTNELGFVKPIGPRASIRNATALYQFESEVNSKLYPSGSLVIQDNSSINFKNQFLLNDNKATPSVNNFVYIRTPGVFYEFSGSQTLGSGTHSGLSTPSTGTAPNYIFPYLATSQANILPSIPTIPANSLRVGDEFNFYSSIDCVFTNLVANGTNSAPSIYLTLDLKINSISVSEPTENPRNAANANSLISLSQSNILAQMYFVVPNIASATYTVSSITNLLNLFSFKVIKTGTSGLILYEENPQVLYTFSKTNTILYWFHGDMGINSSRYVKNYKRLSAINTTISNTITLDFNILRAGTSGSVSPGFVPTFTLKNFIIGHNL